MPDNCNPPDFDRLRRAPIDDENTVLWLEKAVYKAVISKLRPIPSPSLAELRQAIEETKVMQENRKHQALKAVSEVLTDSGVEVPKLERIIRRLQNRPDFQTAFK